MTAEDRVCQSCKASFTIEPEDFAFYERMQVPPPTFCPQCRLIRRLAWRNERSLYRRTCNLCGQSMLSVYSDEPGMNVYCSPCWWSDKWDPLAYGMDFDPTRPFLAQWSDLLHKVPVMPLFGLYPTLVNSDYTNMVGNLKNCYFITHSDFNEDCAYGGFITNSKDSYDNFLIDRCELSYMSVNCRNCYKTFFSLDCESCNSVLFSRNCVGCSDCFGCVNLRQKKYHIFNKPYTKEGYAKKLQELYPSSHRAIALVQSEVGRFWNSFPQKYIHDDRNVGGSGDYLYNSKNARDSFIVADLEDSRFCAFITPGGCKDSWDFTHYGDKSELFYESLQGGWGKKNLFAWLSISSQDIEYSAFVVSSKNIFGSVGLRNQGHCILNKKYSKEEYDVLRQTIVAQMNERPYRDSGGRDFRYGEFFPQELSPFAYNETTAQFYFPMTEETARAKHVRWKLQDTKHHATTLKADNVPSDAASIPDSITSEVIECLHHGTCVENCAAAFRIIPEELQFYRRHNLPLPRLCPQCRYYSLLKQTNPLQLWHRRCQCGGAKGGAYQNTVPHFHGDAPCPNEFETSYAPERPEIVYCESCYNAEVA